MSTIIQKYETTRIIFFFHRLPPSSMVGRYINVHFTPSSSLSLFSHSRYLKKYATLHVTKNLPQYAYLDVSFHMMSLSSLENTTFYDFSLCQNWKERIYLLHWNWQSLSIGCRCLWTRLAYKCIVARDEKVSKR